MDLVLHELPLDDPLSLGEGEDINTHCVTEDSTLLTGRDDELLVTEENQHEVEVRSSSPIRNMRLNMRIKALILHPLRILCLLEIEGGIP